VVEAPKDSTTPAPRPKIADRVGQPSSEQVAPVAQRVVLYDEDPVDPKGKQYVGTVVWRTEQIKGQRQRARATSRCAPTSTSPSASSDDDVVPPQHRHLAPRKPHCGIDLRPAAGFRRWRRRQRARHPDEVERAGARHAARGLAVKVTDGFFLVGLSMWNPTARATSSS